MKSLLVLSLFITLLCGVGCNSAAPPGPGAAPAGPIPAGAATLKGVGKESPDAVLDALIQAAKDADEKAYLALAANEEEFTPQWEGMIKQFSGAGGRENGVKEVFGFVAAGLNVDSLHKRFPAEIDGDQAFIIFLKPDPFDSQKTQYSKLEFAKSGKLWYYTKKSFGPAADIDQAKYVWDRSPAALRPKELPKVASEISATAEAISQAYEEDPAAADTKFKGKLVEVAGLVQDPLERLFGDTTTVSVTWPGAEGDFVACKLHYTAQPISFELWPGQSVKLVGTCVGNPVKPMFEDCRITEIGTPPTITTMTAADLIAAFRADTDAANARYAGQALLIEGVVSKIDKKDQYLHITGKAGDDEQLQIAANWGLINKDVVEAVAKLSVGDAVTLRAICGKKEDYHKGIPLDFWTVK